MNKYDIAITAHGSKSEDLVNLIRKYRNDLAELSIVATPDTASVIQRNTGLPVGLLKESISGGYLHIAQLIANHDIKMVIFLCDFSLINVDESIGAMLQACTLYDVPLANNIATAEFILERYLEKQMAIKYRTPEKVLV